MSVLETPKSFLQVTMLDGTRLKFQCVEPISISKSVTLLPGTTRLVTLHFKSFTLFETSGRIIGLFIQSFRVPVAHCEDWITDPAKKSIAY
jgi:hypothetical protein